MLIFSYRSIKDKNSFSTFYLISENCKHLLFVAAVFISANFDCGSPMIKESFMNSIYTSFETIDKVLMSSLL